MTQIKWSESNAPVNRVQEYLDAPEPRDEWTVLPDTEKSGPKPFSPDACYQGFFGQTMMAEEGEYESESSDWTKHAQRLVERLTLDNRVEHVEKKLEDLSTRLKRTEGFCERAFQKPVCVPVSTFAPEPFEVFREFSIVVQPEEDSYVAMLFDANISSSGETQEEAVANLKDLILMIFKGFEDEEDGKLGPAMIRQKHTLLNLIRRK